MAKKKRTKRIGRWAEAPASGGLGTLTVGSTRPSSTRGQGQYACILAWLPTYLPDGSLYWDLERLPLTHLRGTLPWIPLRLRAQLIAFDQRFTSWERKAKTVVGGPGFGQEATRKPLSALSALSAL